MKRIIPLTLLVLVFACMLAGCSCEHTWQEANCTEPKTCTNCGETEGTPLGHSWLVGTCEKAKHCESCGLTEGEAPGHDWVDATHYAPKTCRTCGQMEGESVPHEWVDATYYDPKTCKICKTTKGEPLPCYDADEFFISSYGFIQMYREALTDEGYILWDCDEEEEGIEGPVQLYVVVDEDYEFTGLQLMLVYNEDDGKMECLSFAFVNEEGLSEEEEEFCMEMCLLAYYQLNPKASNKTASILKKEADVRLDGLWYGVFDSLAYQITELPQVFGMLIAPEKIQLQNIVS